MCTNWGHFTLLNRRIARVADLHCLMFTIAHAWAFLPCCHLAHAAAASYVLTVPASLSDQAKDTMRRCAHQAGVIPDAGGSKASAHDSARVHLVSAPTSCGLLLSCSIAAGFQGGTYKPPVPASSSSFQSQHPHKLVLLSFVCCPFQDRHSSWMHSLHLQPLSNDFCNPALSMQAPAGCSWCTSLRQRQWHL
jgi:hypothetical protein